MINKYIRERVESMFSNILNAIINNMQHIKSLKDVPDLSLTEDVKKEMEKVIHNIYIEYQAFMETNMPKYNIFFKPQRGLELASIEYEQGQGYNFYVSDKLYKGNSRKERLFHEFTHIYDMEYLDKEYAYRKYSIRDRTKTHVYTEVHAEQIRFLYMLGCNTVNSAPKNIDHNVMVFDLNGNKISFYECLDRFKKALEKHYVREIKKYHSINKSVVGDIVDKISYYIGALTIYRRYCNYRISELMDLSEIADYWNIEIHKVVNFYCEHDLQNSNIHTLGKYDIYQIGNILVYDLMNNARNKFVIVDDNDN